MQGACTRCPQLPSTAHCILSLPSSAGRQVSAAIVSRSVLSSHPFLSLSQLPDLGFRHPESYHSFVTDLPKPLTLAGQGHDSRPHQPGLVVQGRVRLAPQQQREQGSPLTTPSIHCSHQGLTICTAYYSADNRCSRPKAAALGSPVRYHATTYASVAPDILSSFPDLLLLVSLGYLCCLSAASCTAISSRSNNQLDLFASLRRSNTRPAFVVLSFISDSRAPPRSGCFHCSSIFYLQFRHHNAVLLTHLPQSDHCMHLSYTSACSA
ncbi:uncharacterized protein B0T15DRAFT_42215 [Chaetomium strumarium]|uniref:Uncharacterized protein n=1 Tax=Chaetomium strumarium TaxID=1170767 RepID=A0AAJ0H2G6_9PEZI|nr:hypothetical protein B0T15DRAFT_42215 [Chaetomium strumarium]